MDKKDKIYFHEVARGQVKMDENEKDFAGSIFKACRSLQRISGGYFNEQIDRPTFMQLFKEELYKMVDSFRIWEKKKDS